MSNFNLKYRPEIDGLRALAVVPVILFHAGFDLFKGGFLGVDIFFVISGYLITTILIGELEDGKFSIIHFYERRARRILPALFLVMLLCIPFALLWMVPKQLTDFSQSLLAVSLFLSNILFWRESGYFDAAAEEKPLLHTWSLAVEEQYYILFPAFLFFAWRYGRNKTFWLIILMTIISLIYSEIISEKNPSANFYLTPSRAWELFSGSICAFIIYKKGARNNNLLALIGFLAVFISIFVYDKATPIPGIHGLLPVLGVVLLILYGGKGTYAAKILSKKLLVGIGLISYSAYLWHQPLFAFTRIRLLDHPSDFLMLFLSFFSLVLAYISYRFVEKPFRNKDIISKKFITLFSIAGIILFATIGLAGHLGKIESRFNVATFDNWRDPSPCLIKKSMNFVELEYDLRNDCLTGTNDFILIGDSHAEALSLSFRKVIESRGGNLITLLNNACLPIPGTSRVPLDTQCLENKEKYWEFIKSTNATVILAARWRLSLEGPRFNNEEGGVEYGDNNANYVLGSNENIFTYVKDFLLEASSKNKLLIINQIPEAGWNVPHRRARIEVLHDASPDITTSYEVYKRSNHRINKIFNSISDKTNITIISSDKLVCNTRYAERCLNTLDGIDLYRDDDHPSSLFSNLIATELGKIIDNI